MAKLIKPRVDCGRGHIGKVRSLCWSADDSTLTTAAADGTLCEWNVLRGSPVRELTQKGAGYTALAGGSSAAAPAAKPGGDASQAGEVVPGTGGGELYTATADGKLQTLERDGAGGLAVVHEVEAGAALTQILTTGSGGPIRRPSILCLEVSLIDQTARAVPADTCIWRCPRLLQAQGRCSWRRATRVPCAATACHSAPAPRPRARHIGTGWGR